MYFTHRNGPIWFLGLKQIFLIYSAWLQLLLKCENLNIIIIMLYF